MYTMLLGCVSQKNEGWSDEATDMFRDLCADKLIYLPTEEPQFVTLIQR